MSSAKKLHVTLSTLAARCGVSVMTASRALRPGTEVSSATRAAVMAAAKELGYRADPFLSVLVNYRRNLRTPRRAATIAYVTNYPANTDWMSWTSYGGYFRGAGRRANELGYGIEEFSLRGAGKPRRAEEVLRHRGYAGAILAPTLGARGHSRLSLRELPVVTLGHSLRIPRLHHAAMNFYHGMGELLHRLKRVGYRRPGFVGEAELVARNEHRMAAAFLAWQGAAGGGLEKVPPCVLPRAEMETGVAEWYRRWRPDVVVGADLLPAALLERAGVDFPRDAGFACANLSVGDDPRFCGMLNDYALVGASALELLHGLILRDEKGVPRTPFGLHVDMSWHKGLTAPGKGQRNPSEAPR